MAAAARREAEAVRAERDPAKVSDTRGAVRQLVAHYERLGDRVIRMLAEETRTPELTPIVDIGRTAHRQWCKRVFARQLRRVRGRARPRRLAEIVAVCDVYTWKLLRRDAGLSRRQTEKALVEMLEPLREGP